jgi:ribosomal subunit interface protein
MQTPLRITFHGMTPSDAIEAYVRARVEKLERFHGRITGCHVVIETPHRHKHHGQQHRVLIDIAIPGGELAVTRDPAERRDYQDLYATIDAAFDDAQRLLEDRVRTQRVRRLRLHRDRRGRRGLFPPQQRAQPRVRAPRHRRARALRRGGRRARPAGKHRRRGLR